MGLILANQRAVSSKHIPFDSVPTNEGFSAEGEGAGGGGDEGEGRFLRKISFGGFGGIDF